MQLSVPIPLDHWTRIQLTIQNHRVADAQDAGGDAGPKDGRVLCRVDGTDAATQPLAALWQEFTAYAVVVGPIGFGPVGEFRVNVDNAFLATHAPSAAPPRAGAAPGGRRHVLAPRATSRKGKKKALLRCDDCKAA